MSATTDLSSLSDAALRERLAYLRALEVDDEDALSGSGYAELEALEAEHRRRNYDGPWEVASGCSEGGAAPETSPSYRAAMRDAGRGHLLGD